MGRVKRKSAFKHAQNVRIHIILHMRRVSSGHLLSIETFYSNQWFYKLTIKALIRLRGCAVWSGTLLSHMPEDMFSHGATVSILYKTIAGRYRPVRVADGPITVRYRFIKNARWGRPYVLPKNQDVLRPAFENIQRLQLFKEIIENSELTIKKIHLYIEIDWKRNRIEVNDVKRNRIMLWSQCLGCNDLQVVALLHNTIFVIKYRGTN